MPRNGSGAYSAPIDFTTEAASPPLEIAKLDEAIEDLGDEITNSLSADGQTNPTANIKMNGFRLVNLGAAAALTDAARVSEVIDQDYSYYVDSGSANTYVITPSPAIAAYEEGQKFCFRAANNNSGASTLNVNALGAFAIQHPDGTAMQSGAIVAGGYYEVVYDANTSPDRWVLMSPASEIADGMLTSNVALENAPNAFTAAQTVTVADDAAAIINAATTGQLRLYPYVGSVSGAYIEGRNGAGAVLAPVTVEGSTLGLIGTTISFTGNVSTPNTSVSEVGYKGTPQNVQNGDYTLVLTDAGKQIYKASGGAGETITIPANGSVAYPIGTIIRGVNNGGGTLSIAITSDTLKLAGVGTTGTRTVADQGTWVIEKVEATVWFISGAGIS